MALLAGPTLAPKERRQARKAFTLVEMLVVIAIIALLASILLPALGNARAMAQRTACQGNIAQILKAVTLYNSDYDGYFPSMKSNGYWDTWQLQLDHYLGFEATPHMSTPQNLRCPAQPLKAKKYYDSVLKGDYGLNRYILNIFDTYPQCENLRDSDINHPSTTIMASDDIGNWQRDIYHPDFDDPTETRRWRHRNAINFGFLDGHVEAMDFPTLEGRGYLVRENWSLGWRDGLIYK